jgi:NhaA family Na+:H+ antiporter
MLTGHDVAVVLTTTFLRFAKSEQFGGILLLGCTIVSLVLANSPWSQQYLSFWNLALGPLSLAHWINDALMAVFFLYVGLELEREFYEGELSNLRGALLPAFAALGGMLAPALMHYSLNAGTATEAGFGIPMATDIAFALGALALLGNRIPPALRLLVVAFAVIDDLGAIVLIAVVYTAETSMTYLGLALATWAVLIVANRMRVFVLSAYLLGGVLLWYFVHEAGIHASIAGVMLAFAIPFRSRSPETPSPSARLEHGLHAPVALLILPLFALANTGIPLDASALEGLLSANSVGILLGLVLGKPLGVFLLCLLAVRLGVSALPQGIGWRHIAGAGMLGGIGFTMSIFITNLAFVGDETTIKISKLAVLGASLLAGILGYLWLRTSAVSGTPTQSAK